MSHLSRRELLGYSATFGSAFLAAQGLIAEEQEPTKPKLVTPPAGKKYDMQKSINLWALPYPQKMSLKECLQLWLEFDREATLEQLRRVMNNFAMPAIHDLIGDSRRRIEEIRQLQIFDEGIYYRDVYLPVLAELGVDRREMRNRLPDKKSQRA